MTSVDAFDYHLPEELIAQTAIEPRDAARCLFTQLKSGDISDRIVRELPDLLQPGDLLVLNRTRVIPARLFGRKDTGGQVEILLIHPEEHADNGWRAMVRGKVRVGTRITLEDDTVVEVSAVHEDGDRTIAFPDDKEVIRICEAVGHIPPLPPYIQRTDNDHDKERYQTVFGDIPASVAAPTASLHLTDEVFAALDAQGIERAFVHLAVGPGTFKPVQVDNLEDHPMHAEHCECPAETVERINACKERGGRVIAVGTTVVRTLESAYQFNNNELLAFAGWTQLFLYPPQTFGVVDGLMTNFHLPRSTLLMLVACLTGTDHLHRLYQHAIDERYRFYSYGDSMLILPE